MNSLRFDALVSAAAALAALSSSPPAVAARPPVALAACEDSRIELLTDDKGRPRELRARVAAPDGHVWSFVAQPAMARVGRTSRTITVETIRSDGGTRVHKGAPAGRVPSQLFIDLLLDDKTVSLRHHSEGGGDPAYALDLGGCTFAGDEALAKLAARPKEMRGCGPEQLRATFVPRVQRAVKLDAQSAQKEAAALCEAHDKMLAAHDALERAIHDFIAHKRAQARGQAIIGVEEIAVKAWALADGCLELRNTAPSGRGVQALLDEEEGARACYAALAPVLSPGPGSEIPAK